MKFSHKDWGLDNPVLPEELFALHHCGENYRVLGIKPFVRDLWGRASHGFQHKHNLA